MKIIAIVTLVVSLALGACLVGSEDEVEPVDDEVGTVTPDEPKDEPAAVAAGCSANVNCVGTKTCGAWSSYSSCGSAYQRCDASCGFITRSGCQYQATVQPQNRTRTCVMRATGATCVEVDYRETVISCPVN